MSDLISRQAAYEVLTEYYHHRTEIQHMGLREALLRVPSAQPHTEADIQKMQDLEQAELEKAFELGREDALSEIVRCKDCKCWDTSGYCVDFMTQDEGGFCKWAERRQDEQTD